MSRKKKNLSSQEMKEEKTIKPDTCHTQAEETTESIEQQETIEATTSENKEKEEMARLEAEIAELKDKYLRQAAEFDNYRKRTLKEKTELILNGGEKIITSLLPVLDDMERAQQNIEKSGDVEALKEGTNLVFKKLMTVLESAGLQKIDTDGKDFDTDVHEAIAMIPATTDDQKGKVIDCVQAGYKLNEKVIRHAKVAIGQ